MPLSFPHQHLLINKWVWIILESNSLPQGGQTSGSAAEQQPGAGGLWVDGEAWTWLLGVRDLSRYLLEHGDSPENLFAVMCNIIQFLWTSVSVNIIATYSVQSSCCSQRRCIVSASLQYVVYTSVAHCNMSIPQYHFMLSMTSLARATHKCRGNSDFYYFSPPKSIHHPLQSRFLVS